MTESASAREPQTSRTERIDRARRIGDVVATIGATGRAARRNAIVSALPD